MPHPDHVVIGLCRGTANILGPATKEEKADYDMWLERKRMFEEELVELNQDLAGEPDEALRVVLQTEIGRTERVLEIIRKAIPN